MEKAQQFQSADEVESAFYTAFAQCDAEAMQALWAEEGAFCIHPGSAPILGVDAVQQSWRHIFSGAEPPSVRVELVHRAVSEDMAVHLVHEYVGAPGDPTRSAVVLATNIYRHEELGWRMLSHQGVLLPVRQSSRPTLQ